MLARSLATLGLGIALAVSAPVISFAQTKPQAAASVEVKKPVKKKVTKAKPATRKVAKAKPSAKKPVEVAEEKKPRGLFAALFGRPAESNTKAAAAKSVKPQVKKRPMREPAAPMPGLEPLTPIEPVALTPRTSEVVAKGNNGELRSETVAGGGFMASIFGAEDQMLPETRALDSVQKQRDRRRVSRSSRSSSRRTSSFPAIRAAPSSSIPSSHFLYLVESFGTARRYAIAVGREGLQFKGKVKVGDKQEWPRWIPTLDMQKREPKKYGQYKDGMPGGGDNPLGARAIYLYEGRKDTHLRIHGTIAPQSIGTNSSNGCFRMINDHVIDLYSRVKVGTQVVVL